MGYNNVDWFVDETIDLENKMDFYFKNTKQEILKTEEDEEEYTINFICRFCEKVINDKKRDHCQLTSSYRGARHKSGNINVTQKQISSIPMEFHNFSDFDCHLFFEELLD